MGGLDHGAVGVDLQREERLGAGGTQQFGEAEPARLFDAPGVRLDRGAVLETLLGSTSTTPRPDRASAPATVEPATPPPTTTTSAVSVVDRMVVAIADPPPPLRCQASASDGRPQPSGSTSSPPHSSGARSASVSEKVHS